MVQGCTLVMNLGSGEVFMFKGLTHVANGLSEAILSLQVYFMFSLVFFPGLKETKIVKHPSFLDEKKNCFQRRWCGFW